MWKISVCILRGKIHVENFHADYPCSFLPLFHVENSHVISTWKYPRGKFPQVFHMEISTRKISTSIPHGKIHIENFHAYHPSSSLSFFHLKIFHVIFTLFLHMINFTNFIDRYERNLMSFLIILIVFGDRFDFVHLITCLPA